MFRKRQTFTAVRVIYFSQYCTFDLQWIINIFCACSEWVIAKRPWTVIMYNNGCKLRVIAGKYCCKLQIFALDTERIFQQYIIITSVKTLIFTCSISFIFIGFSFPSYTSKGLFANLWSFCGASSAPRSLCLCLYEPSYYEFHIFGFSLNYLALMLAANTRKKVTF